MPINLSQVQQLSKLELLAKQIVEGSITGLHKSPFHGFSVEFAEHRLYNTGESTKNIDWKLYARTDKLYTKKFEEETNLRCQILIDTSASMALPASDNSDITQLNKLGFSIYTAAALMFLMRKQRDAVGIKLFDETIRFESEIKNNKNHVSWLIHQLEQELNKKEHTKSTMLIDAINMMASKSHKRSLTIIFSDFIQQDNQTKELMNSLQHLKHLQHEVIVFNVMDKKLELNFEYTNRPTKFIDAETGETIKLNPEEIKQEYIAKQEQRLSELRTSMRNHKIDYLECDINQGLEKTLISYLAKRKNM
ncbi:MAG: hypothetical protein ACJAZ2_001100 [Glaciecola sp.]|jgi:uncharacterized protein (DUF58 family)